MSRLIEGLESIKVLFDTKAKQSENAGYWKDFAGIIADAISTITEKTQRIENMETMIEDMEERIAIMTEHGLWTPVEKQLPEEGKFVLVYGELYPNEREGCKVAVSRRIDFNYWIGLGRERKVTHWMPTPEPPKEGETE